MSTADGLTVIVGPNNVGKACCCADHDVLETGRYENSAAARDFVVAAAEFIAGNQ